MPRWGRRIAWAVGGLLGLGLLVGVLAPLLLRGRVLRWVVARATEPLCGTFQLDDGRLGWMLVPDLLSGRPFAVELRGVRIGAPDGGEVLAAEHVSARVLLGRSPWRAVVDEAVVTHGRWRLAVGGVPGAGFLDAFRVTPAGATRASCVERPVRRAGPRAPSSSGSLVVRDLRLDEVDVDLAFPAWGLLLPRVRAVGSLALGAPGSSGLLFEARDGAAPGGVLRVGREGTPGVTRARFDDVLIARVAVSAARPTDLELVVAQARTGRSRLAGTAVFENIFPRARPAGARLAPSGSRAPSAPPPGLTLDARWEDTSDAVARVEAGWLPHGATLEGVGLGGVIAVRLRGPFNALSGTLSAEGQRAHLELSLERGVRAAADVRADGIDVSPLLDARLRPTFGGEASGRLRATLELAPRLYDVDATIVEADISLTRAAAGSAPRRLVLRVGPTERGAPRPAARAAGDALAVALLRARLHRGTLRLEGLDARGAGVAARGALTLELPPETPGAPPESARLDATLALTVASLARWVAPATATARIGATAHVAGPLEHLRARLTFDRSTQATLLGQRFRPPPVVTATLDDGQTLTLAGVRLAHDGGGAVEAKGRVALAAPGSMAGSLSVEGYPLAQLPGLTEVRLPTALAKGRAVSLSEALAGSFDASLKVQGTPARPTVTGTIALRGVELSRRSIGDGRFVVRARRDSVFVAGTLGAALSVEGTATRKKDGLAADATLKLNDFALAPWLPAPFEGLAVSASGEARASVDPGRPPTLRADVRLVGAGDELALAGAVVGGIPSGSLRGRLELEGLRPLWSPSFTRSDGALAVDLALASSGRLTGTLGAARALTVRPAGWPITVGVAEGGRVAIDGTRLRLSSLTLTTEGARAVVSGDVDLDAAAPARSTLALAVAGQVDAAALARQLRSPLVASAGGVVAFGARATGEARAPALSGEARFAGVEVRPTQAGWPALRVDGVVEARGHALRTRGLRVALDRGGALTLGAPEAPASVELASWQPPRLAHVDVPFTARALRIGDATSALEVDTLDLQLRLTGEGDTSLRLAGDVVIGRARFDPSRGGPRKPGPSRPWYEALPPRLALDLTVRGADDALHVAVPVLPDVSLDFRCHVSASARGARLDGRLHGSTAYSRLALALYDWFKPQDVRACRVFKD